jgi:hypothetical protein
MPGAGVVHHIIRVVFGVSEHVRYGQSRKCRLSGFVD